MTSSRCSNLCVLQMALGSSLPLLVLATAVSQSPLAKALEKCPPSNLLHPFNFSAECQHNTASLNCTGESALTWDNCIKCLAVCDLITLVFWLVCAVTNCVPCNAINSATGLLCPQCNVQCAPWLDATKANFAELSASQLAIKCSTCQPCDFSRCIDAFCTKQNVTNIRDQPTQQLCLFNQCESEDTVVMNCLEYCDVVESGCGQAQSITCKQTQEKYCSVPGRGQKCAATCAMHDNCVSVSNECLWSGI